MSVIGAAPEVPAFLTVYEDAAGRKFEMHELKLDDPLDRHVVGRMLSAGEVVTVAYSCTLAHWATVWRDKAPPWRGRT